MTSTWKSLAPKNDKNSLKIGVPKRLLKRAKPPKTKGQMRVGLKILVAGNPENRQPKTLINRGLKIQNTVNMHLRLAMGT